MGGDVTWIKILGKENIVVRVLRPVWPQDKERLENKVGQIEDKHALRTAYHY